MLLSRSRSSVSVSRSSTTTGSFCRSRKQKSSRQSRVQTASTGTSLPHRVMGRATCWDLTLVQHQSTSRCQARQNMRHSRRASIDTSRRSRQTDQHSLDRRKKRTNRTRVQSCGCKGDLLEWALPVWKLRSQSLLGQHGPLVGGGRRAAAFQFDGGCRPRQAVSQLPLGLRAGDTAAARACFL